MTKDEALKLALNVLVNRVDADHEVITAIREALAQPEQEHIIDCPRCGHCCPKTEHEPVANDWSVFNTGAEVWSGLSLADAVIELTPDRLERGWSALCVINKDNPPLYTTPPHRKPLSDEEVNKLVDDEDWYNDPHGFARAIEQAHGIKENT